jgi:hypothetical protein
MRTDYNTAKNNDKVMNSIIGLIEILLIQIKMKMNEDKNTPNYEPMK